MPSVIRGDDNFDSANVDPSTTTGDVGTYAFLIQQGDTASIAAPGTTTAGSNLQYASVVEPTPATAPGDAYQSGAYIMTKGGYLSGTWRSMGGGGVTADTFASVATLWLRIS